MKELLKWGAMLTGAYLIYQHFQQLSGGAPPVIPGTPATPTATNPPASAINATTRQLLIQATGGAPRNFHEWNWFYNQVRGIVGPAPEADGMGDGLRIITVDEYLRAIANVGLSGWGRWSA